MQGLDPGLRVTAVLLWGQVGTGPIMPIMSMYKYSLNNYNHLLYLAYY